MANLCVFMGRITHDLELKTGVGSDGKEYKRLPFSLAVQDKSKERKTYFFKFVAWNKLAEIIEKHFEKGKRIYVETEAVPYRKIDGEGVAFEVKEINFCD